MTTSKSSSAAIITLLLIWVNHGFCFILLVNHRYPIRYNTHNHNNGVYYDNKSYNHHSLTQQDIDKQYKDMEFIQSFIQKQLLQQEQTFVPTKSKEELLTCLDIEYISAMVDVRAKARDQGEYAFADQIRLYLESICSSNRNTTSLIVVPPSLDTFYNRTHLSSRPNIVQWPRGYQLAINDIPRKIGGGSTWEIIPNNTYYNGISQETDDDDYHQQEEDEKNKTTKQHSVLSLAHQALGLAVSVSSKRNTCIQEHKLQLHSIIQQTKQRILESGLEDLRGRKAADAAFWFALAGVSEDVHEEEEEKINHKKAEEESSSSSSSLSMRDPQLNFSLFTALTCFCIHELQRFGKRSSCDGKYILQMVERMAVTGIQGPVAQKLWKVAAECLILKPQQFYAMTGSNDSGGGGILQSLEDGSFHLHSPRSLLWIWRFASRQRKQRVFLNTASKHWEIKNGYGIHVTESIGDTSQTSLEMIPTDDHIDYDLNISDQAHLLGLTNWTDIFQDPTLPLVVDLGCGMGVSLLGLSTIHPTTVNTHSFLNHINWSQCNFIGADLSTLAIGYATAIAKRWGIYRKRVYFMIESAEAMMKRIQDSYPGDILLITINFPTPFRLQRQVDDVSPEGNSTDDSKHTKQESDETKSRRGNSQLPHSSQSGFMVTSQLLQLVRGSLKRRTQALSETSKVKNGDRYLLIQSNCEDVAVYMKSMVLEQGYELIPLNEGEDGNNSSYDTRIPKRSSDWIRLGGERATGSYFGRRPILPYRGATETEVACVEKNTPIYRFIALPG